MSSRHSRKLILLYCAAIADSLRKLPSEEHLILRKDLKMPKMGGIEFPQELGSDPQLRATPVVVMTVSNQVQ